MDVLVVGGGQAGLAAGHHLARAGTSFLVAERDSRIGESWRRRWDSLRLFTPASVSALPGLALGGDDRFPTKDAVADYLAGYAQHFALPVALDAPVSEVRRDGDRLRARVGSEDVAVRHLVVASGFHRRPRVPAAAADLDPSIVQLASTTYRRADDLPPGGTVLVVGAGNSGAEIAVDVAAGGGRRVVLAGRDVGRIPRLGAPVFRAMRHLRTDVGPGRALARAARGRGGDGLGRVDPRRFAALGVERRTGRFDGVRDGAPLVAGVPIDDVAAVVWCTGLGPDLSWLAPGLEADPAVHVLGRPFATTMASHLVGGVGGDARRVVRAITAS